MDLDQESDLEGGGRLGASVRRTVVLAGAELHGGGSRPGLPRLWELLWGTQVLLVRGDGTAERGCGPSWRRAERMPGEGRGRERQLVGNIPRAWLWPFLWPCPDFTPGLCWLAV